MDDLGVRLNRRETEGRHLKLTLGFCFCVTLAAALRMVSADWAAGAGHPLLWFNAIILAAGSVALGFGLKRLKENQARAVELRTRLQDAP